MARGWRFVGWAGAALVCGASGCSLEPVRFRPADAAGDGRAVDAAADAAADARDAARDTASGVDSAPVDTAVADTAVADSGPAADTAVADTGGGAEAGMDAADDVGADAADAADALDAAGDDAADDVGADAADDVGADAAEDAGVDVGPDGFRCDDAQCDVPAPRPIAPLSTAFVSTQLPALKWELPAGVDGARVEICRDRGFTSMCQTIDATGTTAMPNIALTAGVWFWRLRGRVGGMTGTPTSPIWEFVAPARSSPRNTSWGSMVDINGDGFAEMVVGASGAMSDAGVVHVYLGRSGGVSTIAMDLASPRGAGTAFGTAVANAGDVNGDGYGDLVVGSPSAANEDGMVHVFLGSSAGVTTPPLNLFATFGGDQARFGSVVAGAGDIDGDGYADIVVGDLFTDANSGAVEVIFGAPTGLRTGRTTIRNPVPAIGSYFGASVASAGDVNCDGLADIVVGKPGPSSTEGTAYVFLGGFSGAAPAPTTLPGRDGAGGDFGRVVAGAGDVNGDGCTEVLVSAPNVSSNTGVVYAYMGGSAGLAVMPVTVSSPTGVGGRFGSSLSAARDTDGDGFMDIVVGAPAAIGGVGQAYVFPGSATGLRSMPAVLANPDNATGQGYATAVAGMGDINGDALADVAVGARDATSSTGRVHLFYGGTGGIMTAATSTSGPAGGGSKFGIDIAR